MAACQVFHDLESVLDKTAFIQGLGGFGKFKQSLCPACLKFTERLVLFTLANIPGDA